jgi:hypothetical protein
MRVTARPAPHLIAIATGFTRVDRWMTRARASILICATAAGPHVVSFDAAAFAEPRRIRIGGRHTIVVGASGHFNHVRLRLALRRGWQLLPLELLGSTPTRPVDVVPGSNDARPLVISVAAVRMDGPAGDPAACRRPLADRRTLERPEASAAG